MGTHKLKSNAIGITSGCAQITSIIVCDLEGVVNLRIPEYPATHSDNIRPPVPGYPATCDVLL